MSDPRQWAKEVGTLVRDCVSRAMGAFDGRIKEIEERVGELAALPIPKDGEPGAPGVTLPEVLAEVQPAIDAIPKLVAEAVKAIEIPQPIPGAPGEDGKSITLAEVMAEIEPTVAEMRGQVAEAIAAIPTPANGEDGKSVTLEEVVAAFEPDVKCYLAAIPLPKDGEDGKSVTIDDVKGLLDSATAQWALDFERRAQGVLERAVDRLPRPKDGKDALELEDFDLVLGEDGRTVTLRLCRGDEVREKSIRISALLDRGVYKAGESYEKGDGVTWAGSYWICQKDTQDKPGDSDAFRLSVKRGRDGADGKGIPGKPGEPGRHGKNWDGSTAK